MIRQQHEQLQELQAVVAEMECQPGSRPTNSGPAPREDDLLALSEELERDRRQIQEDEQALMQQMREMEVSMARERAEMARQRNDMQRLQSEIRHELERLERNGALQSKIEGLKNKLSDATTRRGSAPAAASGQPMQPAAPASPAAPSRKEGLMGRLFGR
jgi:chromosome segregation ATPase